MRNLFAFSFLLLSFFIGKGQVNSLSSKDSVLLMNTWFQFIKAVDDSDNMMVKSFVKDSVYCFLSIDTIYEGKDKWSASEFSELILLSGLRTNQKLIKTIKIEKPSIGVDAKSWGKTPEKEYSIAYTLFKPNEIAPGHEGATILFEFNKMKGKFLLKGIVTIP